MANLDLEEQEQLDQLKAFWNQYGNYITWGLIVVLGTFAGWSVYQRWQTSQSAQASALFDELDRVAQSKDSGKIERVFSDLKEKFPSTTYAPQGGLLVAKVQFEAGKIEEAKAALNWVAEKSNDDGYQAIARLRLAGILIESKSLDDALKQLAGSFPVEFSGLVADRRGDVLSLQGKTFAAKSEYEKAYKAFDEKSEYRRLLEVKLNALGVDPKPVIANDKAVAAAAQAAVSGAEKK